MSERQLHPAGDFNGYITGAMFTTSTNGHPVVDLQFQVGEYVARVSSFYHTEEATQWTERRLKALGWNGDHENPQFSRTDPVPLKCVHETYKDKPQAKWQYWPPRATNQSATEAFAARYRASTGTAPPKPTGKPAPVPSRAPSRTSAATEPDNTPQMVQDHGKWDRELCWNEWSICRDEKETDQSLETRYLDRLERIEKSTGKKEAQFGSREWCRLANEAHIPF